MKETVLWGIREGEQDWQEELITSTADSKHLENAKTWALNNGFNRLRVAEFKLEKPHFVRTIS